MSLLIKALDKAENDKSANDKVEHSNTKKQTEKSKTKGLAGEDLALSLSPTSTFAQHGNAIKPGAASKASTSAAVQNISASTPSLVSSTSPASSASPKSAANVFSAKSVGVSNQNTSLALIAGAGLVVLLGIGLYFYQFVDNTPNAVIPSQTMELVQIQPLPLPENSTALQVQTTKVQLAQMRVPQAFVPDNEPPAEMQVKLVKQMAKKPVVSEKPTLNPNEEVVVAENETAVKEMAVVNNSYKKRGKFKKLEFGETIATPSASISVSKTKSEAAGINPVLMSAYEAYNAGDDASAQKLYKQVLQRDVRNVDALMGLGAIASRQGRVADANGWFGKVLEVEPRNSMAQSALLQSNLQSNQAQGNEINNESRIKNMLAKHPDDANLHVALGNLYAEQNQWPAAQQAYFDAYSLSGSADNAFNLAVSLDQMGKPKLALPYYQRALTQATGSSSIDKAALEARIAAIQ